VYKFQTTRGPDRDAEGVKREREWCVLLPSQLGGQGERRKLPQQGPGRAPAENKLWHILELE